MRDLLRDGTRAAHDRVDAGFARFELSGVEGYRAFLQVQAAALLPLEAALDRAGAAGILPDWSERRRGSALLADLAALGDPGPAAVSPPVLPGGDSGLLGVLYTLEGSRLGAAVLARAVSGSPDPQVRGADRFLRHGQGRRFWPIYLAVLEGSRAVRDAPDLALAGALGAFQAFEDALTADEAPGPEPAATGAWAPGRDHKGPLTSG